MASSQDFDTLTAVGPGKPMGRLMRQYWLPAALSSELLADGAPRRLMLLGERLIAFRDSSGRVGVFDHRCPHRCASLFFGRNEHDGLRCVYHGWKFDVAGNCVEMPNVPPEFDYKSKVHARAYQVAERNGVVWVYLGPNVPAPPLPLMEALLMPAEEMTIGFTQRECNYMQALEGDLDTTHVSFLHLGGLDPSKVGPNDSDTRFKVANRSAELYVGRAPWGAMYGAQRRVDETIYWRFGQFIFPFWTMIPTGQLDNFIFTRAWVPMDDTHTMIVTWVWKHSWWPNLQRNGAAAGTELALDYLPDSTDWHGRARLGANAGNDYLIDRAVQRTRSFSGIAGIMLQDQAVTESMGPITSHAFEHLGHSDVMIIQTRRRMLEAVSALSERGQLPPGVDNPEVALGARGGHFMLDREQDWLAAYGEQLLAARNPTGRLHAPGAAERRA
jgi:phthalate 4,5-dioxygenase oxygenase subunit